jgi:GrpB-like predicted nucleotidyltransferase (UPF0157 family)
MIGLEKRNVRIAPHHPSWRDVFQQERHILQKHIGGQVLDIQHVGSTAVAGLDTKPIIEMAVAMASTAVVSACRQRLCNLGYIDRSDAGTVVLPGLSALWPRPDTGLSSDSPLRSQRVKHKRG